MNIDDIKFDGVTEYIYTHSNHKGGEFRVCVALIKLWPARKDNKRIIVRFANSDTVTVVDACDIEPMPVKQEPVGQKKAIGTITNKGSRMHFSFEVDLSSLQEFIINNTNGNDIHIIGVK